VYEASVKRLNEAVGDELHAVHQYMYFHCDCDDQSIERSKNISGGAPAE
jgi:bacterioferritin